SSQSLTICDAAPTTTCHPSTGGADTDRAAASFSRLREKGDRLRWKRGAPCGERGTVRSSGSPDAPPPTPQSPQSTSSPVHGGGGPAKPVVGRPQPPPSRPSSRRKSGSTAHDVPQEWSAGVHPPVMVRHPQRVRLMPSIGSRRSPG